MGSVWIADDDESIRWVLQKAVARQGLHCELFECAQDVLDRLAIDTPAVLVSDVRMPGKDGLTLLSQVRERCAGIPVIVMTAYSDLDSAVAAFQGGAFDYLPKPFDVNKAVELIDRAVRESQSASEPCCDESELNNPEILGRAPAMQEVFRAIGRLSQSNVTVLVTGESGSGKELVARALHRHSPRSSGAFIALNTAAIPKDLLESELFGHERGSFTGAQDQRKGRFEQAEGGTLFLDEIGDMPHDLQARLLRVLSDGHYYRVGGQKLIRTNVRVIAATHQDLEGMARKGLFREDLFHRLNVIRLRLPTLRERGEDIPELAKHFLNLSARELGVEKKRLSDEAMARLCAFEFPGNVRQLENICRWITVMAPSQRVEVRDFPPELIPSQEVGFSPREPSFEVLDSVNDQKYGIGDSLAQAAALSSDLAVDYWLNGLRFQVCEALSRNEEGVMDRFMAKFETVMIQSALRTSQGKRMEAAQRLGIGRNTITRKIQDLEIQLPELDT